MAGIVTAENAETELRKDIGSFAHDPLGFVKYAYPWGVAGKPLANKTGPRKWQTKFLTRLGEELRATTKKKPDLWEVIRKAAASGHGPGKSTLVAWLIHWAMSTFPDTKGIVTANTDTQLRTKTWPEVQKWYHMLICKHWFKMHARSMESAAKAHEDTWRIDAIPWSEKNPEAFAGLHNEGKRILLIFDEASAIADKIWEVSEGALTDEGTEIIWCAFGNPTRNTGRFRECFRRYKHRWITYQIDTREVEGVNQKQIQAWIDDYGEDSDFVRIRVRGRFPRQSTMQFISSDLVFKAMKREAQSSVGDPLIFAFDVARGGDDECVLAGRRGFDSRHAFNQETIPGSESRDSMVVVSKIIDRLERFGPDAFVLDATGIGGPIGDRIKQLGFKVTYFYGAAPSPDPKYGNMRAYAYSRLREYLEAGGALPNDPQLEEELTSIEYFHNKKDQVMLVPKEDQKVELGRSPDRADAQSMLHAFPVALKVSLGAAGQESNLMPDYNPFAD